jgi:bifunctional DNase/RNase
MVKIRLSVYALSNNQSQVNAYALILAEENGPRRLPIIIGTFEAQSIMLHLEGLNPPRPLTHDLFFNFAQKFEIDLEEVRIFKLEEGIFYSHLVCRQSDKVIKIDARTSDAVSLALRFNCPIFTTPEIMEKASFDPENFESGPDNDENPDQGKNKKDEFADLSPDELELLLNEAITNEDYERASILRDEIKKRIGE